MSVIEGFHCTYLTSTIIGLHDHHSIVVYTIIALHCICCTCLYTFIGNNVRLRCSYRSFKINGIGLILEFVDIAELIIIVPAYVCNDINEQLDSFYIGKGRYIDS